MVFIEACISNMLLSKNCYMQSYGARTKKIYSHAELGSAVEEETTWPANLVPCESHYKTNVELEGLKASFIF